MPEGTYPIPLRFRKRLARALRWPLMLWRFKRVGLSWRGALSLTHWAIWYPN